MELKDYQSRVLVDLAGYLDQLDRTAILRRRSEDHWAAKGVRVGHDGTQRGMDPYKNTVPGVPHLCAKVPTAGGKTFIAVNALATVFDALAGATRSGRSWWCGWCRRSPSSNRPRRRWASPGHPYRRRLDQLFRHRVAVYEKRDLLTGAGFSHDTAREQLSIVVMSFDSLRAKNKEDRKIYQENGNLASFLRPDAGRPGRLAAARARCVGADQRHPPPAAGGGGRREPQRRERAVGRDAERT